MNYDEWQREWDEVSREFHATCDRILMGARSETSEIRHQWSARDGLAADACLWHDK